MRHAVWQVVQRAWHQEPGEIFYVRLEPCEPRELTIQHYDDREEEQAQPETHIYSDKVVAYCTIGFNSFPEWWEDEDFKQFTFKIEKPYSEVIAELKEAEWETEYVYDFNSDRTCFRDITEFVFKSEEVPLDFNNPGVA